MALQYYRHLSHPQEVGQVIHERKVQSRNASTGYATWYTVTRYDDPAVAQKALSLKYQPTHRVGPIPDDQMPAFDFIRSVAPLHGQPGLGVEARTKSPVWLFGLWAFATKHWDGYGL